MNSRWSRHVVSAGTALLAGTALGAGGAQAQTSADSEWTEQATLIASDGTGFDQLGIAVAIEGDTALVAANQPFTDTGAVYVFTRTGEEWSEQAKLVPSDAEALDQFGVSVALSDNTALIGANGVVVDGRSAQGAAYVYTHSDGVWSESAKLLASDGQAADNFGWSVALSGDTALVGAPRTTVGDNNAQGAVYAFTGSGDEWSEQAKLTASDGDAFNEFGYSAALSADTALVGAASGDGAAYIFTRDGGAWTEQSRLTPTDGGDGRFGVSASVDGDTALIGAPGGFPATAPGAAYVFIRDGETWSEQAKLTASDGTAGDRLGNSVALYGDTALVGANNPGSVTNPGQGAAYTFTHNGEAWNEQAKVAASDGMAGNNFGRSVGLSSDSALVGAFAAAVDGNENQGAAYVFVPDIEVTLTADGRRVRGMHTVDLSWHGPRSAEVDIIRDGELIATVSNDSSHTDAIGVRGQATYTYQVCEAGTSICSDEIAVRFGGPPLRP